MRHIRMNTHGLHKRTDMSGYGCEATDIHGYPDILGLFTTFAYRLKRMSEGGLQSVVDVNVSAERCQRD